MDQAKWRPLMPEKATSPFGTKDEHWTDWDLRSDHTYHIWYSLCTSMINEDHFQYVVFLMAYVEALPIGHQRLKEKWIMTSATSTPIGLHKALVVAASGFHITNATTIRMWRGIPSVPCMKEFQQSEILRWYPNGANPDIGLPDTLTAEPGDLHKHIDAKVLAQDTEEVMKGARWQEVCFIQILGLNDEDAGEVRLLYPHEPLLAGAGFQRIRPAPKQDLNVRRYPSPLPIPTPVVAPLPISLPPPPPMSMTIPTLGVAGPVAHSAGGVTHQGPMWNPGPVQPSPIPPCTPQRTGTNRMGSFQSPPFMDLWRTLMDGPPPGSASPDTNRRHLQQTRCRMRT